MRLNWTIRGYLTRVVFILLNFAFLSCILAFRVVLGVFKSESAGFTWAPGVAQPLQGLNDPWIVLTFGIFPRTLSFFCCIHLLISQRAHKLEQVHVFSF